MWWVWSCAVGEPEAPSVRPPELSSAHIPAPVQPSGPLTFEDVVPALTEAGGGFWTIERTEPDRVRWVSEDHVGHVSLWRKVFDDEASAATEVDTYTRSGMDDATTTGMGHTKSWERIVHTGPVVWRMFADCATSERRVVAFEEAIVAALAPEGPQGRCLCGGGCDFVPGTTSDGP
ncbi:MAG: hypothetical protein H6738_25045 [Alphaproteobacteria bacterium]|nr:hypothetical protein [Alphaproteobacteria bacterium]